MEKPSAAAPLCVQCVVCEGTGCKECNDRGTFDVTQCPMEIIDEDVWDIIDYAELWKKGIPPIAGGVLDQAHSFIAAARFVFGEIDHYRSKDWNLNDG